ncbi:FAD-dependent monooxygenase [Caballeronia sordidicola]|uniref:Monooxygenase, FAD-binding n=1 Tax=Caballeronia sordidicola TaxID=196367 RepID=A0A242MXN9_CABSO|nr:FAD-dependent monooxygenase [Caballeronia sordidicola]OTP76197.1 monooxygenase, FAD-binding [Caballeronia sordidicola]
MNMPASLPALTLEQTLVRTGSLAGPRERLPQQTQVLIVGGGPAGLTALHLLTAHNIDCVLIEKNLETSQQPKAIAVDDEYLRLLTNLGVGEVVLQNASAPFGIHFISSSGKPLVTVNAFRTPNGFGNRVAISQPLFEKTLLQTLPRLSNTVCYGSELQGIRVKADSTEVDVKVSSGEVKTITTRFVLACDGARSAVRSLLGIGFPGKRIDEPHLVIDLADFPDQTPASRFHCLPARPFNSIPGPFGGRRLEFMLKPEDDRAWLQTDEGIRWIVDEFSPYKGIKLQIIRRAIYGFSERIADRLQEGGVFLLGDAAHVMPPFGGQGINTGARDAANITWKLAAVLNGSAPQQLLESYDPERRHQITKVVEYSVRIGKLTNIRSTGLARLRDRVVQVVNLYPPARDYLAQMRYMPRPRIHSGLVLRSATAPARTKKRIGTMFPRLRLLTNEGSPAYIDQHVGFKHALVFLDASDRDVESARKMALGLLPEIMVVDLRRQSDLPTRQDVLLTEDPLTELFFGTGVPLVILVRPDKYIAAIEQVFESKALLDFYLKAWRGSDASRTL